MSSTVPGPAHRLRRTSAERQADATPIAAARRSARHFAIVGAGMAGVVCARTLVQAGHRVTVLEKSIRAGGRSASVDSPFGSFDAGAQFFTVRTPRFASAIASSPGVCQRWHADALQMPAAEGGVDAAEGEDGAPFAAEQASEAAPGAPQREAQWVASPAMQSLVAAWADPLLHAGQLLTQTRVTRIEADGIAARGWQLRTEGPGGSQQVYAGFDAVLLAQPAAQAQALLTASALGGALSEALGSVTMAPCWTLMLAYPQALRQPAGAWGPPWHAARSAHQRIAWLARESSKPGRNAIERWTVQAAADWSARHLEDDAARVQAKLLKAFAELSGIRAAPAHADTRRWRYAQTTRPLGQSHLWDADRGLGVCGDWCLGRRLEDAFVSGLELALAVA